MVLGLRNYKKEYGNILKLAFPVILSQAGQILVQLVDNAMVGRLGAVPLAGVSFAGSVHFMIFVLGTGLTFGLTPLVGEMYSRSNYRKSAHYLQNSLLLYALVSLVLCTALYAVIPLMKYMGQPAEVVEAAIPYYRYLSLGIIPFMIFAAFKQFLEGIGNTKIAMTIIITSNVINVLFNWLLIYGNWGFPNMGAAGAGLATLISRILTPILVIFAFYKKDSFNRYFSFFSRKNFSWGVVKSLLKVGSPISLQMFMEGGAFALGGIMMGWVGTMEIAGNQIASVISNFAFMIVIGINSAVTICISHQYGMRDWKNIRRYASAGYRMALMWNTVTALLFITLRRYIPMLFTSDPAVIEWAANFLIFVALFQFSDGLQAISIGILRGVQDVKQIMWIAFVSYILVSLPVGYLLTFHTALGAPGIWAGLIVGLSLAAVLLNARYRKQLRIHLPSEA